MTTHPDTTIAVGAMAEAAGHRTVDLAELRIGRNFVRPGDTVRIKSTPGKRDAYVATVRRLIDGNPPEIEVVGPRGFRTYRLDRISRVAQTRNGERVGR